MDKIRLLASGAIGTVGITNLYTNNTGADQLLYLTCTNGAGGSALVDLSLADPAAPASRIASYQIQGDGLDVVMPFVIADGQTLFAQGTTNPCTFALMGSDNQTDDKLIFQGEVPAVQTAVPNPITSEGQRVIMATTVAAGGTNRLITIVVDGTNLVTITATNGDTKFVDLRIDANSTIEILAAGAGASLGLYMVSESATIPMIGGELT